ncbi:unnamed protein product [Pocillopora meandrina]|uniref:Uncharacterized protein n=1 Tax=Pocillopora meandrina TaxID=46732 RepID=A0AAU9XBC0_9CNID|nr:unnamed protein product [Pocillopora meandrina]
MNDLVPPFLSNYFIRNHTIHTYATSQRNDIRLPNPKLTLGKNTFRFSARLFLMTYPHRLIRHIPVQTPRSPFHSS